MEGCKLIQNLCLVEGDMCGVQFSHGGAVSVICGFIPRRVSGHTRWQCCLTMLYTVDVVHKWDDKGTACLDE
eukprot:566886-Ditylum_brightwellii.AAC.1